MEYAVSSKVDFVVTSKSDIMNIVVNTNKIVRQSVWPPSLYLIGRRESLKTDFVMCDRDREAGPDKTEKYASAFLDNKDNSVYEIWESEEAYTYAHMTPELLERRENLIITLDMLKTSVISYSKWNDLSLCSAKFIRACDVVGEYPTARYASRLHLTQARSLLEVWMLSAELAYQPVIIYDSPRMSFVRTTLIDPSGSIPMHDYLTIRRHHKQWTLWLLTRRLVRTHP